MKQPLCLQISIWDNREKYQVERHSCSINMTGEGMVSHAADNESSTYSHIESRRKAKKEWKMKRMQKSS